MLLNKNSGENWVHKTTVPKGFSFINSVKIKIKRQEKKPKKGANDLDDVSGKDMNTPKAKNENLLPDDIDEFEDARLRLHMEIQELCI